MINLLKHTRATLIAGNNLKRTFSFSAVALLLVLSFSSCKKYPNGPVFSLHTKAERVANNWKVAQALDDGHDVTSDYNKYELSTTRNGGANLSAKYKIASATYEYVTTGTWAFVSNKEKISFDFDNNDADGVYVILKLMEDEMWLKEDGGSLEFHFVTR